MRLPSKQISPESGRSSVASRCSSVLLPQPLGPTIDTNSPSSIGELDALQHGNDERRLAVALADVVGGEESRVARAAAWRPMRRGVRVRSGLPSALRAILEARAQCAELAIGGSGMSDRFSPSRAVRIA